MSEQQRADNRAAFPLTADLLDEWRSVFGPGVRLLWAEEDGKTIGKKPERIKAT